MDGRDDYRQTLQMRLNEFDMRLGRLGVRAEALQGRQRLEARRQLQACRAQRGEALARLQQWDEVSRRA